MLYFNKYSNAETLYLFESDLHAIYNFIYKQYLKLFIYIYVYSNYSHRLLFKARLS